MIGAIIGDIVGSRFEFNPTNDMNFELFTSQCNYTDDTICTVAIADAVMNRNNDFAGALVDWCDRYPNPMGGYGGRFAQWLENPVPYNSFGNGSAMRVSPIAWLYNKHNDVFYYALLSSVVSHNHPDGINGACATAWAIRHAIDGCKSWTQRQIEILTMEEYHYPNPTAHNVEKYRNKFYETMPETIPVALWCFGSSLSFENAIRRAVSFGGDADTLGAITGSIAHAYFGVPRELYNAAMDYLPEDMKIIVEQFNKYTNGQKVY